jgi:LuxR family maltose regulon positive regulatory protein
LLNEITTIPEHFALVLDDYHVMDAQPVDRTLAFLIEHLPPQMHLVIATREDPDLPLARLRAQGQLTELRATDLRFTPSEAAEFLNQVMSLNLSVEDIAALETCTEGWIAGLQLAAISMQGYPDATGFIKSFTGSHHFVLDFLVEEVLHQQPESIQTFLLRTSILDRLCGPLCDAVLCDPAASGQNTLEYLEHANLFIVSLDNERRWYRYHHLFADLLRQRLHQNTVGDEGESVAELHGRASRWYEDNGLEIEAFHHAAAANDIDRAGQLIAGKGMPLHFRGALAPVFNWLASLPTTVLDARPGLWVTYAAVSMLSGHMTGIEQNLQAAEKALLDIEPDDKTQDIEGQIAAIRALLAGAQNQADTIIALAHRALELLHPDNLSIRTIAVFALGIAYQLDGGRAAASQAYTEVLSIGQASGNIMFTVAAEISLGNIQEVENQLHLAAETYQRIMNLVGDPAQMVGSEAHQGLARIFYEWNDLDAAGQHRQQSARLALQLECDTSSAGEVMLARLKLAQGDATGAAEVLAQASARTRQNNFAERMPQIAAAQVLVLLRQGYLETAARLAQMHDLPLSQARVLLAQGDTSAALAVLEPLRQQAEEKVWHDEQLKVMVLQALAHYAHGEKDTAIQLLGDALALAEPEGFIRLFVDEGIPMAQLLSEAATCRMMPDYIGKLLAVFEVEKQKSEGKSDLLPAQPLIEPLSKRELEVLRLIAQGLSNREIGERLFLALSTVKGHSRIIYDKLQVQRRTEAVARARELGLL